ncbi:uncharacterized protein LOC144586555 [Pogona vitticeps]
MEEQSEDQSSFELPGKHFVTQRTVKIGGASARLPLVSTATKALHQELLEAVEHSVLTQSGAKQRITYGSSQLRRELQKGNIMAKLPAGDIQELFGSDTDPAWSKLRQMEQTEDMAGTSTPVGRGVPARDIPDETAGAAAAAAGAEGPDPNKSLSPVDKLTLMFADFFACHTQSVHNQNTADQLLKQYREKKVEHLVYELKEKEKFKNSIASVDRSNLPYYHDGDDILSFLSIYEQACRDLRVPEAWYVKLLRTQCSGQLANIVAKLSAEETDWDVFKEVVKRKFGFTLEILRQNFRKLKKQPNECYSALADKIEHLGDQWLSSLGVSTFEDLRTVLYMEHFLNLVPSEIRSTLLERDYKDLQTLALKTDEILSFKRPEPAVRAKTAPVVPKRQSQFDFRKSFSQEPRQSSFEQRRSLAPSQSKTPLKCFECGGSHL